MRSLSSGWILTALLSATLATPAIAQAPNDNCSTPMSITGNGSFPFNFAQAATDIPFVGNCGSAGGIDLNRDLWYCWTATCTGQVTITTCGQTTANTAIAIYNGCACPPVPAQPVCCNDDTNSPTCGRQSTVTCQVECDHQYMIQLGDRDFGLPGASGTFTISCEGTPCGGGHECPPGECCGATPRFAGSAGPMAVTTILNLAPTGTQVQVIDLLNSNSAPAGSNWNAAPFLVPDPSWSRQNLGTVFGVAIDGQGNIYVAHSSSYGTNFLGMPIVDAVGSGGPGAIYKISTSTAVASPYITLPNTLDPVIAAQPGYTNEAWPGLGNISIDCTRNTLFATNFDDGRIYRIALGSGTVLSAYDHASNTVTAGGAPEVGDAPGFARLGERVWAVEPHNGRVYYSIWGSDLSRSVAPNTIWSIQMDPSSGEFLPGTRQQEVLNGLQTTQNRMPCSDISFTSDGHMMLAQRTMGDGPPAVADTLVWAHESYVLEFVCDAASGGWTQGNTFATATNGYSAAGGVDADFRTGQNYNVWATSDALIFSPPVYVYGLQGFPATGGTTANSALIDSDQDIASHDKTQQGSVEVSCPSPCARVDIEHVQCVETPDDGTGIQCYDVTFTITNQTSQAVQYVLLPALNVTPHVLGPFAPGTFDPGDSLTFTVQVCGVAGTTATFPIILMNTQFDACCNTEVSVDLPDCDCLQILNGPTVVGLGGGQYSISFTYQPLEFNVSHVFFNWEPVGNPIYTVDVNPTYFPVSVPQWSTGTLNATFTINPNGGPMPTTICFRMFIHRFDLWTCCSVLICVEVPSGGVVCPGDTNGDGIVDLTDLAVLLGNFGTQSGATPATGDFNNDGAVDLADLTLLLSNFGVPCD
jgi:hypothetical protein